MKVYHRVFQFMFLLFLSLNSIATHAQDEVAFYFDSDQHELKPRERQRLMNWLQLNQKSKILSMSGFTDEDGSSGYNDALAQRRIDHIFSLVQNRIAIREDFKSINFGKKHKQSENKAANRKVTIYFLKVQNRHQEDDIIAQITGESPNQVSSKPKQRLRFPDAIEVPNPDGSKMIVELDTAFMQQVNLAKVGEKLKVDSLNFHVNTFAIVNESRPKLYELLMVMYQNPDLKIEIQGHLCCNPKDTQDLSTQRAKAVHQFLIMNGIDRNRLGYRGFGSKEPIYPLPERNEEERAANRRVEILILKN